MVGVLNDSLTLRVLVSVAIDERELDTDSEGCCAVMVTGIEAVVESVVDASRVSDTVVLTVALSSFVVDNVGVAAS